jgi:large subunit ribosomal protein L23
MRPSEVLIKPILTEKANGQQESLRRYAFRVARKANKLEIKKAVEAMYGVTIVDVNTVVVPGKKQNPLYKEGFCTGTEASVQKSTGYCC